MEAEGARLVGGHPGEELLAGLDRGLGVVVHRDGPADVLEHEQVVVDDVADVDEGFVPGADLEAGVAVGVARRGDDLDRIVEEFLAVLRDDQLVLEDVEVAADRLDHVRQRPLVALRLGEVGVGAAPEIILLLEQVDLRVGEGRLIPVDEPVEVVGVRVAEEPRRHLLALDAEGAEAFLHPAEVHVRVALAEARVDEGDLVADAQAQDVHVEGEGVEPLAMEDHRLLHLGPVGLGPHQVEPLAEEHVPVADGEGFDGPDLELVDVRVGRALHRRLGRLLGGQAGGPGGGQAGEGEGGGAEELAAGGGQGGHARRKAVRGPVASA